MHIVIPHLQDVFVCVCVCVCERVSEGVCVCVYVCVRYHIVKVYYVYCHTVPARRICVCECV